MSHDCQVKIRSCDILAVDRLSLAWTLLNDQLSPSHLHLARLEELADSLSLQLDLLNLRVMLISLLLLLILFLLILFREFALSLGQLNSTFGTRHFYQSSRLSFKQLNQLIYRLRDLVEPLALKGLPRNEVPNIQIN